jgi:rfaE bifunctional protein kinase chain/domain
MKPERIQELFAGFDRQRVLVLGDFMIDEYRSGRAERLSPEAPVPVILEHSVRQLPGGAGNVVKNLAALKVRSSAIGLKGRDEGGQVLVDLLNGADQLCLVEDPSRPTTRKMRILAGTQQICRLDQEDPSPVGTPTEDLLIAQIRQVVPSCDAVIISDYDKGVVTERVIDAAITSAGQKGAFVSVDPQVSRFGLYRHVGVLTPNHHEAGRFIARRLETDSEVEDGGREIMRRLEPSDAPDYAR